MPAEVLPVPAGYLERLREICSLDTPTGHLEGLDRCAQLLAAWAARAGAHVELLPSPAGLHLIASVQGAGSGRTLLVGHHDTVFPLGTAPGRPLAREGSRVLGPGVADMKGGVLVGLAALERLAGDAVGPHGRVELHCVPDEEGRNTAPFTLERMRGASAALALECGRASGAVVTARKAGTWLELRARGRAAHAGAAPEDGRSALSALCSEALRIEREIGGGRPGVGAIVTRMRAGDSKNTIPAEASATVDLRATTAADLEWAVGQVGAFDEHDGVSLERSDDRGFPPMVRDDALASRAVAVLRALGEPALEETAGGVSDGSWTSSLGVPTVDGLGPVGGDDHSDREWIDLRSVGARVEAVVRLCQPGG